MHPAATVIDRTMAKATLAASVIIANFNVINSAKLRCLL